MINYLEFYTVIYQIYLISISYIFCSCLPYYTENSAEIETQMQANRRSLTGASAANSIVTGLENSSLYTGDTISITVTAKDLSGNFVTTGGDIFTVKISNLWTKYNDYYCKPNTVTGPLFANVNDVMTDHNNGTHYLFEMFNV